jgi:hypothetical protein
LISNLVYALYGNITKSVENGRVVWNIPCDPNNTAETDNIPREEGEGLLCYLLRVFNNTLDSHSPFLRWGFDGNDESTFTLSGASNYYSSAYLVYVDGVVQDPITYTVTGTLGNPAILTFTSAIVPVGTFLTVVQLQLKGNDGATGATGEVGATGVGATGFQGATGPSGGPVGATGATGEVGATGVGATGFSGATGAGATGATGEVGATGVGATGFSGATGAGATGATGVGSVGATGATGAGATGFQGATGLSGTAAAGGIRWQYPGDGVQTIFNINGAVTIASEAYLVSIDGIVQDPDNYTIQSGAPFTLTMSDPVPANSSIVIVSIIGPIGPTGVSGLNGSTGATGPGGVGATGATGVLNLNPIPNSGIDIAGNSIQTLYNSTIPDSVLSVSVGGASPTAASVWKTKNIVQALDDILFPTILASVGSAKSVNLSVSGSSGILEIGSSFSRILTSVFSRGTIINGNGTTNANPLVGADSSYTFTGTGISSTTQTGNTLSFTSSIVSGSNNWAVTVNHGAGTGDYFDNKGVVGTNLDPQRVSGSVTDSSSSPTITGVFPYYYFKSSSPITPLGMVTAIQNGTATKVIASSTGTLSIPYSLSAEYIAVAYPNTSTVKTRYYVTTLDNGAITVIFDPVSTESVVTALWTQNYFIHVSTSALTNSNPIIELRNT